MTMSTTRISRREALQWTAAGGLALACGRGPLAGPEKGKIGVGVQLYSVRDVCEEDFDSALQKIAGLGFEGVEFAGYYAYEGDAAGLRKRLDALGLKAAGTHIGADAFLGGEVLKAEVDFHKTLGCTNLICYGDERIRHPEESKGFADAFNEAAEVFKAEGLRIGYHNHVEEFEKADGEKSWWDLFVERTTKEVALQIDFGHALYAGVD
jgi:sugar phosphate isomerase/epimerase